MASLEYDESSNALYIRIKRGKAAETEPITDNLILDLNKKGEIIGIEILGPTQIDIKRFPHPIKILTRK
ncbi:MAG: DUF2283 domain-containing protein [Candidatus Bathyarchaeia archaeon]